MTYSGSGGFNWISDKVSDTIGLRMHSDIIPGNQHYYLFMNGHQSNTDYRLILATRSGNRLTGIENLYSPMEVFNSLGYANSTIFMTSSLNKGYKYDIMINSGFFSFVSAGQYNTSTASSRLPVQDYGLSNYLYLVTHLPNNSTITFDTIDMLTGVQATPYADTYSSTTSIIISACGLDFSQIAYFTNSGDALLINKGAGSKSVWLIALFNALSIGYARVHKSNNKVQTAVQNQPMTAIFNLKCSGGIYLEYINSWTHANKFEMISCLGAFKYSILISISSTSQKVVSSDDHSIVGITFTSSPYIDAMHSAPDAHCIYSSPQYKCSQVKVFGQGISSINIVTFALSGETSVKNTTQCIITSY